MPQALEQLAQALRGMEAGQVSLPSCPPVILVGPGCGRQGWGDPNDLHRICREGQLLCYGPAAGEGGVAFSDSNHKQMAREYAFHPHMLTEGGSAHPEGVCKCKETLLLGSAGLLPMAHTLTLVAAASKGAWSQVGDVNGAPGVWRCGGCWTLAQDAV